MSLESYELNRLGTPRHSGAPMAAPYRLVQVVLYALSAVLTLGATLYAYL